MSNDFNNQPPANQSWNDGQTWAGGNPADSGPQGAWRAPQAGHDQTAPVAQNTDAAGFFRALFDVSFSHFVTPKVVKFIYILAMVAIGLTWLLMLIVGLSTGDAMVILLTLIVGPIMAIIYLTFIRMTLEFYLATVRMSEDIHKRLR